MTEEQKIRAEIKASNTLSLKRTHGEQRAAKHILNCTQTMNTRELNYFYELIEKG